MALTLLPWQSGPTAAPDAIGSVEVALPEGLTERMTRTADRCGAPDTAVLVAAAARVFAQMGGESVVDLRVRAAGLPGPTLRVDTSGRTWRQVVTEVAATTPSAQPVPYGVGDAQAYGEAGEETDIWVRLDRAHARLVVRHRVDLFGADHARRVAGYVIAALRDATGRDDRPLAAETIVSPAEVTAQLDIGRGRSVEPPAAFVTDLIAQVVTSRPGDVAILAGEGAWTYAELWRHATDIAALLRQRGVVEQDVVAVDLERGFDWAATVLAVLRIGAVYLPVEPDHPADRIAGILTRAGCRFAVADRGAGLPTTVVPVDQVAPAATPATRPAITAGSLAYIYFTSGSTGAPKGAMCEHAGLVNHIAAKVEDLGLTSDDVVVQSANASFDISLWQLLAPLTVGGRSLIVARSRMTDVPGFLDDLVAAGATVLQVVPSYLDVLLHHLEAGPRRLDRLRWLSVTGEAVGRSLVARWLALYPRIGVVNAYGATEASDDTTHEIMLSAPDGDHVPVGRPVPNVQVYILEPGTSRLQPLGCVGEIAFSGVCVGRGYVNDEASTRAAFQEDPYRPGARLYRTGDFGRWLPSGSIEFHGRRDEQVKVSGHRIELGEVECRLAEVPGVRAATVVAVNGATDRQLAGYYTSDTAIAPDDVREHLASKLPSAAVPAILRRVDAMPLTGNGKVDKTALVRQAGRGPAAPPRRLRSPSEIRIADAWARAIGIDAATIGPDSDFFELGGTSLGALRVVAQLDGLLSIEHMLNAPVLRALAAIAEDGGDSTAPPPLLRPLGVPAGAQTALICLPYAGGGALSFRAFASAVRESDSRIAVYAVQPPGHDLSRRHELPVDVPRLGAAVAEEVAALNLPVILWGQDSGAALAIETAARLDRLGIPVRRILVASRRWRDAPELAHELPVVSTADDVDLGVAVAAEDGLDGLSASDLAFVGRAFRHDVGSSTRYLLDAVEGPPTRVAAGITVVAAADDPAASDGDDLRWLRFASDVDAVRVEGGGSRFARTRPDLAAAVVLRVARGVPA
jgi:amino acid adenylation domain-containing protein